MSQQPAKAELESETSAVLRPWGVSFAFVANAIMGVYYLAYPILRDINLYPLYALGVLCLIASYGLMKMTRWGVWLGGALYAGQLVAPVFSFLPTIEGPGIGSDITIIAFAASLVVLMFLSTLSFLFILDRRKSFK